LCGGSDCEASANIVIPDLIRDRGQILRRYLAPIRSAAVAQREVSPEEPPTVPDQVRDDDVGGMTIFEKATAHWQTTAGDF